MPDKITLEMREKLRVPLPAEAVSQHPTKKYLSSIKSIYVAERINDVFGIGTWTLKGELIERVDYQRPDKDKDGVLVGMKDVRFVVVKAVLEIPEYGFYGEAYGGNDNDDIGDAYKGAVTDGFTKIAAPQLEIGIDVFRGAQAPRPSPGQAPGQAPVQATPDKAHRCEEHDVEFFMRGKMKSFGHPVKNDDGSNVLDEKGRQVWCHEHTDKEPDIAQAEKDAKDLWPADPQHDVEASKPQQSAPVPSMILGQAKSLPLGEPGIVLQIRETGQILEWEQINERSGRWLDRGIHPLPPTPVPDGLTEDMSFTDLITWVKDHKKNESWLFKTFSFDVAKANAKPYECAREVHEMMNW